MLTSGKTSLRVHFIDLLRYLVEINKLFMLSYVNYYDRRNVNN